LTACIAVDAAGFVAARFARAGEELPIEGAQGKSKERVAWSAAIGPSTLTPALSREAAARKRGFCAVVVDAELELA
jgi:hypothetical protein